MNKYSRLLSYAAILVCLTPLGGVYTLLQTLPWMNGNRHHGIQNHASINVLRQSFQSTELDHNRTCAALPHHLMDSHKDSAQDSQDPIRYDAGSFLDNTPPHIDTSYRTNTTQYQHQDHHHHHQQQQYYESHVHSHQQQGARSLHQQREQQPQFDPLMFHVRNNNGFYNQHNNHVLLLSWTLSLLLGLLIPVFALLHDAYQKLTSKSRHQQQLQAIQKALKPYKRKVLTKSQAKETCPICLSHFAMGESIATCGSSNTRSGAGAAAAGGCSHSFHQTCMVQWLLQQTKNQPNQLVETILSNQPAMSTLRQHRRSNLEAPCPCCRQPFVTVPLVR